MELNHNSRPYIFYYMIYSCKIEIPEAIHEYRDEANKEYMFEKSVKVKNFIVPIYVTPYSESDNHLDLGLYDTYIPMKFGGKLIEFSKVLDYIQQCRNIRSFLPSCTTSYKFTGYYYDDMFNVIKVKTLNIIRAKSRLLNRTIRKSNSKSKSRSSSKSRNTRRK